MKSVRSLQPKIADEPAVSAEVVEISSDSDKDQPSPKVRVAKKALSRIVAAKSTSMKKARNNSKHSRKRKYREVIEVESDEDANSRKEMNSSITLPNRKDNPESIQLIRSGENAPDILSNGDPSNLSVEMCDNPIRNRPKRAAAKVAESNIKVQTNVSNQGIQKPVLPKINKKQPRRLEQAKTDSPVFQIELASETDLSVPSTSTALSQCFTCKLVKNCVFEVLHFGANKHFCSTTCFSDYRGLKQPPASSNVSVEAISNSLPCSKCNILSKGGKNSATFFWETMNFCSDMCVGQYLIDIGSNCGSCSQTTEWQSVGKYCVRFGNEIMQFCSSTCLEDYKKAARVCFYCQLDMKNQQSVTAPIVGKSVKEFCSHACWDMYWEVNFPNSNIAKEKSKRQYTCVICGQLRTNFRVLVTHENNRTRSYPACSNACWDILLIQMNISDPQKCMTCPKYLDVQHRLNLPTYPYIATFKKTYAFCSGMCKNIFILRSRHILPCSSCRVKKYNFDLIQCVRNGMSSFAVCSLNCIPLGSGQTESLIQTFINLHNSGNKKVNPKNVTKTVQPRRRKVHHKKDKTLAKPISGRNKSYLSASANSNETEQDTEISLAPNVVSSNNRELLDKGKNISSELWNDIEEVLNFDFSSLKKFMTPPKLVENKICQVTSNKVDVGTQVTEEFCQNATPKVVPLIIPIPIHIPVPMYALDVPCPVPMAVPIPIPIPVASSLCTLSSSSNLNSSGDGNLTSSRNLDRKNSRRDAEVENKEGKNGADQSTAIPKESARNKDSFDCVKSVINLECQLHEETTCEKNKEMLTEESTGENNQEMPTEESTKDDREMLTEESTRDDREMLTEESTRDDREMLTEESTRDDREMLTEESTRDDREMLTEESTRDDREMLTEESTRDDREMLTEESTRDDREMLTEESTRDDREMLTEESTRDDRELHPDESSREDHQEIQTEIELDTLT